MAGRANSVTIVCFILVVFMGPAAMPGNAIVRGTGEASSAIKVCTLYGRVSLNIPLKLYFSNTIMFVN